MNPEKWEAVDTMDTSSGVMVSNLPLIFAHGEPTSLNNMNLDELEVFVPFMVRCSVGEDLKTVWSQLPRPLWWPNRLPFRVPSASTPQATKSLMVRLIERCYAFHGCQYLLQFCTSLHQMKSSIGYRFTDNRDGTTSMFDGPTGKLLVTFRNENRDYDKTACKPRHSGQPQKKLLLANHQSNSSKNDAMVRKSIADVFLCDKCDDEFLSLKEVLAHEKQCKGNRPLTPPMPSPEPEILDDDEESEEQVPFLSYLGLQPAKHTGITPYTSPRKKQQQHPPPMKKTFNQGLLRFESIDITSPLGTYVMSKSKYGGKLQMPEHFVSRYERHVRSSEADLVATRERSASRWYVVWRPRKDEQPWVHLYCFTADQKREKLINLQTGLDKRSRNLLSKCKKARIKLKRLAKRVIDRSTRLEGGRSVPCIDLTSGEDYGPSTPLLPSSFSSSSSTSNLTPKPTTSSSSKRRTISRPHSRPSLNNNNFSFDMSQNSPIANPLAESSDPDPLQITQVAASRIYSTPLQGTDDDRNSIFASEDALTCLPVSTRHSLNELSNNGVTVTSLYYPDASQPDMDVSSNSYYPRAESPRLPRVSNLNLGLHNNIWPVHSIFNNDLIATAEDYVSSSTNHPDFLVPQASSGNTSSAYESFVNKDHSVEVIDLSSDEDEPGVVDRSYARSKNGYSHWSLDKKHSKIGRNKRCPVTNGTTHESVPPQPITSLSCSSIKNFPLKFFSNSLDGKLRPKLSSNSNNNKNNNIISPLNINTFYKVLNTNSHLSRSSTYGTGRPSSRRQDEVLNSIMPHLTVDSEGYIKTPMQIDEDISFNIRLNDPLGKYENSDDDNDTPPKHDCHSSLETQNPANVNNNNNNNNLLHCLSNKVNKGLLYLTSFVKSKVFDSSSLYPFSSQRNEIEKNYDNNNDDDVSEDNESDDGDLSENDYDDDEIKNSKLSNELNRLMSDECRELKRRGIGRLKLLNDDKEKKIMTRFVAERTIADMNLNTRASQFRRKPYKNDFKKRNSLKSVNSNKNGRRTTVIMDDLSSLNTQKHNYLQNYVSLYPNCSKKLADDFPAVDENKNYQVNSVKEIKRPKMNRELSNLARDECKELKGMGFHPADILGSSDNPAQIYYESDDHMISPPFNRRPSLISFKSPSGKNNQAFTTHCRESVQQMMQGNKKLSRELSKLMSDEWKELKRANAHPSQVAGLLSVNRNVRSFSSVKRREEEEVDQLPSKNNNEDYFSLGRCSRTQEKATSSSEVLSPRISQRKMLHSENGMCVLGYTLVNQT